MDATLRHLRWTLAHPWHTYTAASPTLRGPSIGWHEGPQLAEARAAMQHDDPIDALLAARVVLGLPLESRSTTAYCRDRRYGWRPGLYERFQRKIRHDVDDGLPAGVQAVRALLDVAHIHPWGDGNARCALLLADWIARGPHASGLPATWAAIARVPMPPGEPVVPRVLLRVLGAA